MSHDHRSEYFNRDRDRDRDWGRSRYRRSDRSRSRSRSNLDKRRSRTPRKSEKDIIDDNILSEISKLPEPSELWDNPFPENNFSAPPPPSFPAEPVPNTAYNSNYPQQYTGIYDEFNSVPSAPPPPEMAVWNQMSLPPPHQAPPAPVLSSEDQINQIKKEAAIESEMRQQKAALSKQREEYIKKAAILKKELDTLKEQRNELRRDAKRSPSPDTNRFLKENTKLQLEIQNKVKTITNVVEMLNGIIGEEASVVDLTVDADDENHSKRKSRSPTGNKFNYVYYDPEMHWCRVCDEFPPTAKDYLNHLHSPAHHKMAAAHMEAPWHSVSGVNDGFPNYPAAPTKRTPIRGLQFFVPSTAWYCKLCDQFIGDLHCASAHLKSVLHSKNYTNFVEQNPHWETDWMSDRQKAVEKYRSSKKNERPEEKQAYTAHTITFHKDGFHTKNDKSPSPTPEDKKKRKEKKKKCKRKRSSSGSSTSLSSSDSEPKKKKRAKKDKHKQSSSEKSLTEWVSNLQMDRLTDSDRKLLDNLKNRIKKDKKDEDKRRSPSRASRDRERERSIADLQRRLRETERRDNRPHDDRRRDDRRDERRDDRRDERRDDRRDERRDDRRDERRDDRRDERRPTTDANKPEIRKMPFIGKMPVFKNMVKPSKANEQKKEEPKIETTEEDKKRQQEMDAEIQKKVAEFKEKIAKAQLERQQQLDLQLVLPPPHLLPPFSTAPPLTLPPPTLALPPPAAPIPTPTAPQPPQPNLSKDFQDALDIIFPSGDKNPELATQDMFSMPPAFPMMPPFQPLGLMQPPMFGFDMNGQIFPRPQLYDAHVPIVKPRPQKKNKPNQNKKTTTPVEKPKEPVKEPVKNKEELDDLAMLGIDATDVGAGI